MRIQGLISAFNQVRRHLQAGLRPEEVEPFRKQVQGMVRQVEALCRENHLTPAQLPGPSRMAYTFFKELDLDHLPVVADLPADRAATLRVKNVVNIGEFFAHRLWEHLPTYLASLEAQAQMRRELAEQAAAVERICAQNGVGPGALEVPSRQVYCWLKFLSSEDHLTAHLAALQRADEALQAQRKSREPSILMFLVNLSALWRKRAYRNGAILKVSEGFLYAGPEVWQALARITLSRRDERSTRRVREYAESEDFGEVLFELDSFATSTTASTHGRVHNLEESFDRVNRTYFGGRLSRPILTWNRTPTARKFGHYQSSRDLIMISISLDDPSVSPHLVDFVMYHELLHKKLGVAKVNGRRLAHSPAFRAAERRFAGYDEVSRQLDQLAGKQRMAGSQTGP